MAVFRGYFEHLVTVVHGRFRTFGLHKGSEATKHTKYTKNNHGLNKERNSFRSLGCVR
jgi:hypothetical protein